MVDDFILRVVSNSNDRKYSCIYTSIEYLYIVNITFFTGHAWIQYQCIYIYIYMYIHLIALYALMSITFVINYKNQLSNQSNALSMSTNVDVVVHLLQSSCRVSWVLFSSEPNKISWRFSVCPAPIICWRYWNIYDRWIYESGMKDILYIYWYCSIYSKWTIRPNLSSRIKNTGSDYEKYISYGDINQSYSLFASVYNLYIFFTYEQNKLDGVYILIDGCTFYILAIGSLMRTFADLLTKHFNRIWNGALCSTRELVSSTDMNEVLTEMWHIFIKIIHINGIFPALQNELRL